MNNSELKQMAKSVRKRLFEFTTSSRLGHLATSLSCVDIVVSLYGDPQTPFNHKKDILIFGKAHGSPVVYPILSDLGYFDPSELKKYCTPEGILRMHADGSIPGCHFVGGSLGNGIGYATGLAYQSDRNVFVILGDAELYEGSVWESLIFIAHHKISNLCLIVDRNGLGTLGETEKMLRLDPLDEKMSGFGLDVQRVDGHDFDDLRKAFTLPHHGKPRVVIAQTIKGKGVSYMEGVSDYHTKIPQDEKSIRIGLEELS